MPLCGKIEIFICSVIRIPLRFIEFALATGQRDWTRVCARARVNFVSRTNGSPLFSRIANVYIYVCITAAYTADSWPRDYVCIVCQNVFYWYPAKWIYQCAQASKQAARRGENLPFNASRFAREENIVNSVPTAQLRASVNNEIAVHPVVDNERWCIRAHSPASYYVCVISRFTAA